MIALPRYDSAGDIVGDIAGQYLLEAHARRDGLPVRGEFTGSLLTYRFAVGLPASSEERELRVEFSPKRRHPRVFANGPRCLRHRWGDDSLCMWDPEAVPAERWVLADGLGELAGHAALHLSCESQCRAGLPWPKAEMPGAHPRKRHCPSCRGKGK